MKIELITSQHLSDLKMEIINEIKQVVNGKSFECDWMKSKEVKKVLGCSEGTLANLRATGVLPYSKISGTLYFRKSDLQKLFENNIEPKV